MKKSYLIAIIIIVGLIRGISILKQAFQQDTIQVQVEGTGEVVREYTEGELIDIKRGLQKQKQQIIDDFTLQETQEYLAGDESKLKFINEKINGLDKQIQQAKKKQGLDYLFIQKADAGYIEPVKQVKPTAYSITHNGFKLSDIKQEYVNFAEKLGGAELRILFECENGNRDPQKQSDAILKNGKREESYGFCQINKYSYPEIVNDKRFFTDWKRQMEQCLKLRKGGTPFYGPERVLESGKMCYQEVGTRFIIN